MFAAQFASYSDHPATDLIYQARSYVFGTLAEITICSASGRQARHLGATVLADFDRLHRMLHAWDGGELVALNNAIASGLRDIPIKPELARLVCDATGLSERSHGLFNPAIGKFVRLWNFHASEFLPADPGKEEIDRLLRAAPKMKDLAVADDVVNCSNREVQLDFGGYAKGYALDRTIAFLRRREVPGALVNIGGNLMALGTKLGLPWRVGIQHPREARPMALLSLLDGEAISTSGDYERYFIRDGKRYCHLIDPRTGQPACAAQSTSVLVERCANAGAQSDASSGALFIGGSKGWRELSGQLGLNHTLLVDERGELHCSEAMRSRLEFV